MTYRPRDQVYGPPWVTRLPTFIYLALALTVAALVFLAERSPAGSFLYEYFVAQDVYRAITSRTFATLLVISASAALLRSSMRGVRVRGDGVECRELLGWIWPRVRRIRWAQIDTIVLDQESTVALDLWDGSRAFLPPVGDLDGLSQRLEYVAAARAIPVRGGKGLFDIPDRVAVADE